jgi:ribosomally synthesized peptide (two-chain TOMM family)
MSNDPLLEFRTLYLRAVARAWADDPKGYRATLVAKPEETLRALAGKPVALFDTIKLELDPNGASWDPEDTSGWFGTGNDQLTIHLPLDPKRATGSDDPKVWVEAIADFYATHPSILGSAGGGGGGTDAAGGVGAGRAGSATYPGGGFTEEFLNFGSVLFEALALAWKKAEFRDVLQTKTELALQGWLDFTSPWNIDLKVVDDTTSTWTKAGGWKADKRLSTLKLFLPNTPAPVAVLPIALGAYNGTGPAYPFTCCA